MMIVRKLIGILIVCSLMQGSFNKYLEGMNVNLGDALQFLREYDNEASAMCTRVITAQWNFATNVTEENRRRMIEEQSLKLKFDRISWRKAVSFAWSRIGDPFAQRELKMIAIKGRNSLTDDKFNELHNLILEMKEIYARTRVCPYRTIEVNCDLSLDHDVNKAMAKSKNYDELLYYWHAWHEATGPQLKTKYIRYVQLANQAARLNGFQDAGDQMREFFEEEYFQQNTADVMSAIMHLYKNLFTYVRTKLFERYGDKVRRDGPLPAHILGNMWAQNWEELYDLVQPFPASKKLDVTLEMMIQSFTSLRIFQIAEEFFTSLGMKPMPPEFWRFSLFEKPIDRDVKCSPSAWDFCNRIDYRIKQCTRVTMEDLLSAHHEIARLQYYLQYRDQPLLFRNEAIPGFFEAVSDAIELSVFTPQHLSKLELHDNTTDDYGSDINFLMLMALRKIAYMPFAYIVDEWRWYVFNEGVADMTNKWWELRLQYQGIVPPVPRSERDFDPGSKYHVPADALYAKYFVGVVLQFQLFESLCEIAGHTGDLHTCDFYRSRDAGRLLSDVLSMGSSKPWKDVVRQMTRGRTNRMDAGAILRYFEPLNQWLKRQNEMEPVVGWITNRDDTEKHLHYRNLSCNYVPFFNHIKAYEIPYKHKFTKNILVARYYNLNASKRNIPKIEPAKKVTVFAKMKQMTKDYWHVLIPVHIITSIGWMVSFYFIIKNGVDITYVMELMHFSKKYVEVVKNSDVGNWALAYLLYKIFTPLRYTITIGCTTMAIRQLSKSGIVKPLSFGKQSHMSAYEIVSESSKTTKAGFKTIERSTEPPKT
ncbi:angiotensin-converting enzyme-like [Apis dorsata]|uniref:angiotensin-converting enzyme-like n=1 Tax=Apis dorsata TaxID=7462 RepID=UPI0003DF7818|nr:angiotensin-converting enzyme-like [Apis dorsata]